MLLTHALALSANQLKSPFEYVHSVGIELAKLIILIVGTRTTYQATGDDPTKLLYVQHQHGIVPYLVRATRDKHCFTAIIPPHLLLFQSDTRNYTEYYMYQVGRWRECVPFSLLAVYPRVMGVKPWYRCMRSTSEASKSNNY